MLSRMSFCVAVLLVVVGAHSRPRLAEAQIAVGQGVVAVDRAPVKKGEETVLTVEPGTRLVATAVRGDWIGVRVKHAGEEVTGWILARHLRVETGKAAKPKKGVTRYPRELSMQSLPAYRIAPPDIVLIEVLKLVPRPPYRVEPFDVLRIQVTGALLTEPILELHLVESDGTVNLGPAYGKIRVLGMTIEAAGEAIVNHLKKRLRQPEATVQLAKAAGTQPVTGEYLIDPDGTVNLRRYGSVRLAGKTVAEAEVALEKHLAQYFDSPDAAVDVVGYNSMVYYIIEETGQGDKVVRVPITGNETVLDAVSTIGSLPQLAGGKIRIVRPAPSDTGKETVLPVDWDAITRRGATATNYQIMPGDRVLIGDTKEKEKSND